MMKNVASFFAILLVMIIGSSAHAADRIVPNLGDGWNELWFKEATNKKGNLIQRVRYARGDQRVEFMTVTRYSGTQETLNSFMKKQLEQFSEGHNYVVEQDETVVGAIAKTRKMKLRINGNVRHVVFSWWDYIGPNAEDYKGALTFAIFSSKSNQPVDGVWTAVAGLLDLD